MDGLLEKHLNEALPLAESFSLKRQPIAQPQQSPQLQQQQLLLQQQHEELHQQQSQQVEQQQQLNDVIPGNVSTGDTEAMTEGESISAEEASGPQSSPPPIVSQSSQPSQFLTLEEQEEQIKQLKELQLQQQQQLLQFHEQQQLQQQAQQETTAPDAGPWKLRKSHSEESESSLLGKIGNIGINDLVDADPSPNVTNWGDNLLPGFGSDASFKSPTSSNIGNPLVQPSSSFNANVSAFNPSNDYLLSANGLNNNSSSFHRRIPSGESLSGMLLRAIEPTRAYSQISEQEVESRVLTLLNKHRDGLLGSDMPRFYWDEVTPHNKFTSFLVVLVESIKALLNFMFMFIFILSLPMYSLVSA